MDWFVLVDKDMQIIVLFVFSGQKTPKLGRNPPEETLFRYRERQNTKPKPPVLSPREAFCILPTLRVSRQRHKTAGIPSTGNRQTFIDHPPTDPPVKTSSATCMTTIRNATVMRQPSPQKGEENRGNNTAESDQMIPLNRLAIENRRNDNRKNDE